MGSTGCVHAVSSCQNAIIGSRCTAALDVSQHRRSHVISSARLDLIANDLTNTVESLVTKLIHAAGFKVHRPLLWEGAFCNADDAVFFTHLEAALHRLGDFCDIERLLGHHRVVRATSHARVQGNPPHMAAHNLHNQNTVMRFRGGM